MEWDKRGGGFLSGARSLRICFRAFAQWLNTRGLASADLRARSIPPAALTQLKDGDDISLELGRKICS